MAKESGCGVRQSSAIALTSVLLLLLQLAFGSAYTEESGPQWTVSPWVKNGTSNNSHPSTDVSALFLSDINLSGHEPTAVLLSKKEVSFREYPSCVRSTELWLESGTNWTQYSEIRQGQSLKLVAYTPSGGDSDLYLIDYSNSSILHKGYHLHPGYGSVAFWADKIGRMMIVLMVENQPSNVLMLDVLPRLRLQRVP